jgi:hypothetical protein
MNLQKYFERLGEKVRKNNKRKKREIARATGLDPIRRAFPSESIDVVNPAYNNSSNTNDCILSSDEMDGFEEVIGYGTYSSSGPTGISQNCLYEKLDETTIFLFHRWNQQHKSRDG